MGVQWWCRECKEGGGGGGHKSTNAAKTCFNINFIRFKQILFKEVKSPYRPQKQEAHVQKTRIRNTYFSDRLVSGTNEKESR